MSAPRRIGLDVHALGGRQTGNETYARQLAAALLAREDADLDYTFFHTRPLPAPLKGAVRVVPHTPLLRLPVALPRALRRARIELAHFQYVLPPRLPCPAVVTVHDISYEAVPECFPLHERLWMSALVRDACRRAAHVLTVSEHSRRDLIERYGVPPGRVSVTHEAAGPEFRPLADDERRPAAARLGVQRPFLLAVGNVEPRKNLARLVRCFAGLLADRRIDHDLLLVGQTGRRGSALEADLRRLAPDGRVRRLGYVPRADLVALYGLADAFVYPSLYEGFGLPVLEAMACGAPVLASNTSSLPEVAGDAALLVDPRDDEALREALARLATEPALRAGLARAGLRRAAKFSWEALAAATTDVYRRCLAKGA